MLEFQSKQRMWALEQEAVRAAMQDKLRNEVGVVERCLNRHYYV